MSKSASWKGAERVGADPVLRAHDTCDMSATDGAFDPFRTFQTRGKFFVNSPFFRRLCGAFRFNVEP